MPTPLTPTPSLQLDPVWHAQWAGHLCAGIDTVAVDHVRESLAAFGERFVRRLFTPQEASVAHDCPSRGAERLAARFAAKEATIKALGLSDVGVDWRDIEVRSRPDGAPELVLHGRALAQAQAWGVHHATLSLSHDGSQACALVVALAEHPGRAALPSSSSIS